MPDGSADCIVTSPPYWGKRDYRVVGQYGHEPDPAAYVDTLRGDVRGSPPRPGRRRHVLAQPRRLLLRRRGRHHRPARLPRPQPRCTPGRPTCRLRTFSACRGGLPSPSQDDGWILRNAIVWHKPNAMPESVRDRLNCRYELIFLLVKQPSYWFDLDPIRIPRKTARPRLGRPAATARCDPAAEVWPARPPGRRRPAVRHRPEPPRAPERP